MHLKWLDAEYFQVWDGDTALKGFQGLTAKIVVCYRHIQGKIWEESHSNCFKI